MAIKPNVGKNSSRNYSDSGVTNESYCFCGSMRDDDLMQCEGISGCPFARNGLFHAHCLGFHPVK